MSNSPLLRLLPQLSPAAQRLLDGKRAPVASAIRAEIYGPERFIQHGQSLGAAHLVVGGRTPATFFPRLQENVLVLREAKEFIATQAATGYAVSPASEWLLDNFHLIEAQLLEIREGLPRDYFRMLPVLQDQPLAGLPRVYGIAWSFVAHTDGAFDEALLTEFLGAYQEAQVLKLSELWALPTTLRVVLIESLRRIAERLATNKAAVEAANQCFDDIDEYSLAQLDELVALMSLRGVDHEFLLQFAQRLLGHPEWADEPGGGERPVDVQTDQMAAGRVWLRALLPNMATQQAQQIADQAADNLSVSNAVLSLRAIGGADWPEIIAGSSALMQLLLSSSEFAAEHASSRDRTLHGIEVLARRSGHAELAIAESLVRCMDAHRGRDCPVGADHWLVGAGQTELMSNLAGLNAGWPWRKRISREVARALRALALPIYLAAIALGTLALVVWLLPSEHSLPHEFAPSLVWLALLAVLLALPASEAVVAVVNRLMSESIRPAHLRRLAFNDGIPATHRVLVVIPSLLTSAITADELLHRLELHYLANPETHAQFGLVTDWGDADSRRTETDDALMAQAVSGIAALSAKYSRSDGASAPRFVLLHRERRFSDSEQRWIGWERKRGKLTQLIDSICGATTSAFLDLADVSRLATDIRYVLTLDSDTWLPPGRLRELVGVAAHPQNEPQLDPNGRFVTRGYGILQPRLVTPLPASGSSTGFHWLFAGQCGSDPYSVPSSEVYQDLFAEGTFTGKGLLHVQTFHALLSRRLPDNQVLSHDLLEGAVARCATVSDVTLIEEAPGHADVAAARLHRWTRGDWQLLPFLLNSSLHMHAVNRWKMFDNLRRSLVSPACLALLVLGLLGIGAPTLATLALIGAAFSAGPLMGAVAGFVPGRDDIAKRYFYFHAGVDFARAMAVGLWHIALLLQHAYQSIDAILRALWRMTVSHRLLLQWTTAAASKAAVREDLYSSLLTHWREPLYATFLFAALSVLNTPQWPLALSLCLVWGTSPLWSWLVSQPWGGASALPAKARNELHDLARDTWRFFERTVGPADNHLPPDNLQTSPHDIVAHRTSPTNIGLYLLSAACARQFGWIGTCELLERLEATLVTLARLTRHRGHFLNWYDTQTCAPLLPMYVSAVDSGNLTGHLLAVAQACRALAHHPLDGNAARQAVTHSRRRLASLHSHFAKLRPALHPGSALATLLVSRDPLGDAQLQPERFDLLLREATQVLASHSATSDRREAATDALADGLGKRSAVAGANDGGANPLEPSSQLLWCLADHLALLRSWSRDLRVRDVGGVDVAGRLIVAAATLESFAWAPDFKFLYHRKRHLLHIGYRVAEQQLDAGFFDLLASESRLTSLLAIAKGDVPAQHWAALGRPFYGAGLRAGLRSWSGSMFEYLMPSLILDEPIGSVLRDACIAALREQIDFARGQHVPWGISESAYAGQDHTLAYQYAPQGVPRLALRRTPSDEVVIAPYASALALQISPLSARNNLWLLATLGARQRYGFIEALDYASPRQAEGKRFTRVESFMAHHQGMSIVALANVLLDETPRRWAMATSRLEAVWSLLHERPPRQIAKFPLVAPSAPLANAIKERSPGMWRELLPSSIAVAPTHMLSNGRYNLTLRCNGAGCSRLGGVDITRRRDDSLRDSFGWFFYLRWSGEGPAVSITQRPAPDSQAIYRSAFHADRVCFDASWASVSAHSTVWVSPEDDIEFRQIEVCNLGDDVLDIELISAFEVTLAPGMADAAHAAFSNLFLQAAWRAPQQAQLLTRKPRLSGEPSLLAAHFLAATDVLVTAIRVQTDRQRWAGRNRAPDSPVGSFNDLPEYSDDDQALATGLDPVSAFSVRLRIPRHAKALLTFALAAADDDVTLRAIIDKYRQPCHVQRASLMSATLAGIRLRTLRISSDDFAAVQTLTTALVSTLTKPRILPPKFDATPLVVAPPRGVCDRRLLWRFGISGDRPLVLVFAGVPHGIGLVRTLAQVLHLWSWGGVACDLVVLNAEPSSYLMLMQREIQQLRERHLEGNQGQVAPATTGFQLIARDTLSADELETLRSLARVELNADGRPLAHHVREWIELHERARAQRQQRVASRAGTQSIGDAAPEITNGTFEGPSGDFSFEVHQHRRPTRPWVNVLANPRMGCLLSEAGGGYTWALNSRMNQLTAWSNDPVSDPPAEWFLLQDRSTHAVWSITASAWGNAEARYQVTHGQGYSAIHHRHGDVDVCATWCVDPVDNVKQVHVALTNRGTSTVYLRLAGMVEWMLGADRRDRATTRTEAFEHLKALASSTPVADSPSPRLTALMCTQREHANGFGQGTAFFAAVSRDSANPLADGAPGRGSEDGCDWTCDRRECFDADGRPVLPDRYGGLHGLGLDPCAAISTRLSLDAGASFVQTFLLGYAESPSAARALAVRSALTPAAARLDAARAQWQRLSAAVVIETPDPLFDVLVNRWLLYQVVSCRLWARAGFYQAGGAFGFRDQLQDALALAWCAPDMLRQQIVLSASRQFAEGDVQHWWHAPSGAGVRTHFSDDLLWLPFACLHYLDATGDAALLDQSVSFLEGPTIADGVEDAYYVAGVSTQHASVYEHAARTIDRSLRVGVHGLPLMGSGDWNDGMNRVGLAGRGESVWLGFFLHHLVTKFAPYAVARGDVDRAQRWQVAATAWQAALTEFAWDGAWFKRAFFDDGQGLGSNANAEARIDLIAQAWSVLSDSVPEPQQRQALVAMETLLVDVDAGLIRLLDPPLVNSVPNAGYIQSYPPGVRENGAQYNHAAVWALMAQAEFTRRFSPPLPGAPVVEDSESSGDKLYRYFKYVSPAHRSADPHQSHAYGLEPYAVAGDIYSAPPYVGRGGWSWYTGAAAWLQRAAIESMFGLNLRARELTLIPCLPTHWQCAELTLHRDERTMRFIIVRGDPQDALLQNAHLQSRMLLPAERLTWIELPQQSCFVVPLDFAKARPPSSARVAE